MYRSYRSYRKYLLADWWLDWVCLAGSCLCVMSALTDSGGSLPASRTWQLSTHPWYTYTNIGWDVIYTKVLERPGIKPRYKEGQEDWRSKSHAFSLPHFAHCVCPMYHGIYQRPDWWFKIYFSGGPPDGSLAQGPPKWHIYSIYT